MKTASQEKPSIVPNAQASTHRAPSIKHQPRSKRFYFDVGIGSVVLAGADTGGAYCLIEASLAPGVGVPRHMHTREDESYYVLSGELEVIVGGKVFVLKAGDSLMAPRDIPHQIMQFRRRRESLSSRIFAVRARRVSAGFSHSCARQCCCSDRTAITGWGSFDCNSERP